jgi:hypothetical protein
LNRFLNFLLNKQKFFQDKKVLRSIKTGRKKMPNTHSYIQRFTQLFPRDRFFVRLVRGVSIGIGMIFIALYLGMLGYHWFEHMSWTDAFVNAAMILSGMGPMGTLTTTSGKIFAGIYALFSGLFFIAIVGLIFGPLAHRLFKKWHMEDESK